MSTLEKVERAERVDVLPADLMKIVYAYLWPTKILEHMLKWLKNPKYDAKGIPYLVTSTATSGGGDGGSHGGVMYVDLGSRKKGSCLASKEFISNVNNFGVCPEIVVNDYGNNADYQNFGSVLHFGHLYKLPRHHLALVVSALAAKKQIKTEKWIGYIREEYVNSYLIQDSGAREIPQVSLHRALSLNALEFLRGKEQLDAKQIRELRKILNSSIYQTAS